MFSIVIPTFERNLPFLKLCIESIKKNSRYEHEIIVVTNGGEPYDVCTGGSTVVHRPEPGQCGAVNYGFSIASNDAVCAIDDDMYVTPDWDYWLWRYYQLLKYPLVCSVRYEYDCASPFVRPPEVGRTPEEFNTEAFEKFWDEQQDFKIEEGFNVPWLWSKEIWNTIGGYDEAYDPYASNSDSDLLYRVRLAGLKPLLVRRSAVFHFVGSSGWKVGDTHWQKNYQHFVDKFGFPRVEWPEHWHGARLLEIPQDKLIFRPPYYEQYGKI